MDENEPVDDGELIFRRIHVAFFDAALSIPVQREAFRPSQNDATGLSVFRAKFGPAKSILTALDPEKAKAYHVARLSVAALKGLGLTVVPDPLPEGPVGHSLIPELSWSAYQRNKQKLKITLLELAKIAGTDIVHSPQP
jgi:hypothetical protein